MSTPPNTGATELGVVGKLFDGTPGGRRIRDLDDMGEVFLLAREIADGDARRATLLSVAESRAIAVLAVTGAVVLEAAIALIEASDAGDVALSRTRLEALCAVTRKLMVKEPT